MDSAVIADTVGLSDRGELKTGKNGDMLQVTLVDNLPVVNVENGAFRFSEGNYTKNRDIQCGATVSEKMKKIPAGERKMGSVGCTSPCIILSETSVLKQATGDHLSHTSTRRFLFWPAAERLLATGNSWPPL